MQARYDWLSKGSEVGPLQVESDVLRAIRAALYQPAGMVPD